jgi:hypothetical protein
MVRAAGAFGQRGGFAGDMSAEPLADGVATASEFAGGGLEAVLGGEGDKLLMQPMVVGAHTIEFKVGAAPPPEEVQQLILASCAQHLDLHHRGVTMSPAFPIAANIPA